MDAKTRMLLLETSSRAGEVALGEGTQILGSRLLAATRRNASDLASVVDELLRERDWKPTTLQGVAVSLGPGSFTSLRVGLMSAKALSYAIGCPFFGVPTFRIIAEQCRAEAGILGVISDALQGMVYSASYLRETNSLVERDELSVRPLDQFLASLPTEAILTGPGVESYSSRLPGEIRLEPPENRLPQCRTMLALLQADCERFRCDPYLTEPIYLRGSSAEEKRKLSTKSDGGTEGAR